MEAAFGYFISSPSPLFTQGAFDLSINAARRNANRILEFNITFGVFTYVVVILLDMYDVFNGCASQHASNAATSYCQHRHAFDSFPGTWKSIAPQANLQLSDSKAGSRCKVLSSFPFSLGEV